MKEENNLHRIIKLPESESLGGFVSTTKKNLMDVYSIDSNSSKLIPFDVFAENVDHGANHVFNVYKKSLEVAKEIERQLGVEVNKTLLYIMSVYHDSGRFREPIISDQDTENQIQAKQRKKVKSEREHARYGVAQIKLWINKLKEKWVEINEEDKDKIENYILNHDFFNTRLDWTKYKEPYSLEWQITRLSDRISTPIEEEIERYRETWKRMNTTYFKKDISFQERIDFTFTNMWTYLKTGRFDEFTFFLTLLSQAPSDFSNPVLHDIYAKRQSNKNKWIKKILEIAKEEKYSDEDITEMKNTINQYLEHFDIRF